MRLVKIKVNERPTKVYLLDLTFDTTDTIIITTQSIYALINFSIVNSFLFTHYRQSSYAPHRGLGLTSIF